MEIFAIEGKADLPTRNLQLHRGRDAKQQLDARILFHQVTIP